MPSDDLEPRVAGLEGQVGKLGEQVRVSKQDAAAARILAGAADRDVEEFRVELRGVRGELREVRGELREVRDEAHDFRRATTASFNALREDLTDLRGGLTSLRGYVDNRFDQVDNGFIEMRGKFDAAAAGQQHIVELLEGLIAGQG